MVRRYAFALLVCSLLLLASPLRSQGVEPIGHITINPSRQFQVIQGFGTNFTGPYFRPDMKHMFNTMINDLGISMFRVVPYFVFSNWEQSNPNSGPGDWNWEYYDNRYSDPVFEATWRGLQFLNSQDVRPILALMGAPPTWMTAPKLQPPPGRVCNEDLPPNQQMHLSPAMYEAFAKEVVSMAVYARTTARIDFRYFSPFNETDCYPHEGPRIDPDEAPKVLDAIARLLRQQGLGDVRLVVADQAIVSNNYIGPILQDVELMRQVGAFSLHNYSDASIAPQVERVKKSQYPNVPVWVTEYGDLNDRDRTFGNEWTHYALAVNRRALSFINEGASAIFYFDAFDDYEECMRRLTYYGLFTSMGHIYARRKRYYATWQLYHFVPPGSQRIASFTDAPDLTVSAFRSGARNTLVIVGVKEGGPNSFQISIPDGSSTLPALWELYETTPEVDGLKMNSVPMRDGTAIVTLPDQAVFTLVGHLSQ